VDLRQESYATTFSNLFFEMYGSTNILKSYFVRTDADEKLHQRAQYVHNLSYFQSVLM